MVTAESGASAIYRSWRSALLVALPWLSVALTLTFALLLSFRAMQPPKPLDKAAPLERFSEGRARDIVYDLSERIGRRVNGTEGYTRAVEYLAARMREISGVEVEIYPGHGTYVHRLFPAAPIVYRNLNVLGRLPGKTRESILLDAHFDTLQDSVGAADDAAGVACVLEVVRALAREAPLDRTIVVNLNGGEESGLLGAAAFLNHPWAKDVRAYVYLEALPSGKAFLIGAGPQQPWLAKTYARVVPAPLGSIVGQELTQSGLLPFNGDFQPFHAAGLVGLDVAMTGDASRVHTDLDRLQGLQPGGMQHLGDATLAVTRALVDGNTRIHSDPEHVVYYDLVGLTMLAYPMSVAKWLGAAALACFLLLFAYLRVRRWISARQVLIASGWHGLGLIAALLAAVLPAVALRLVHRSIGWFSAPSLLIFSAALPAFAGMLIVHAWWRSRAMRRAGGDKERVALSAWMGAVTFWAILLFIATLKGLGAGYVALYWVAGGVVGLVISMLSSHTRLLGAIVGLVPGVIVTVELSSSLILNFAPMAGMFPARVPVDLVVVLLVAAAAGLIGMLPSCAPCRSGGAHGAGASCATFGLIGVLATAAHAPYSSVHPKRLTAIHAGDGEQSAILLAGLGADGMQTLLPLIPRAQPAPATWSTLRMKPISHLLPAPLPAMLSPRLQVSAQHFESNSNQRRVLLHVAGTSPQLKLSIPAETLLGWSATERLAVLPSGTTHYHLNLEGVPPSGVEVELTLRGSEPVDIELLGIDGAPASGPAIQALRDRLPDWVTLSTYSYRRARWTI